jgi:hypothetical protein
MEPRFAALAADLDNELHQLDRLIQELATLRQRLPDPPTTLELRAAGSILHDFYNGAERSFERVATVMDSSLPTGANWHVELLSRMAYPIPGVRPAVISDPLRQRLGDYLRFRHLFRNIYGSELRWDLLRPLVSDLPDVHRDLAVDVRTFVRFLQKLAT